MNKWVELVMAWFVGGMSGRLIGYTILVGHFGLPEFSGWLSVPIGSALAWLVVEPKVIAPSLKHAYVWTKKPEFPKAVTKHVLATKEMFIDDLKEFPQQWGWRILRMISCSFFWGSWLLLVLAALMIPNREGSSFALFCIFILIFMAHGIDRFCQYVNWKCKTYDRLWRYGESNEQKGALEWMFCFLMFNPVSVFLVFFLIAGSYWLFKTVTEIAYIIVCVVCWLSCVLWKTVHMINSSQRMIAMTGAAIGLSLSQIWGFNPLVCSIICVASGLAERFVFILAEKVIKILWSRQRILTSL